jgi:2-dehydropantoate 2-reductase
MARVTVVGAGAIGGFVGARLAAAGHEVTLVDAAADHLAAIRRDGLHVRGAAELRVRVPALAPEELAGRLGTVLLCVKARHTLAALEAVTPWLDEEGCVVSLQNGLEEHRIAKVVGAERTVGAFLTFGGYYAGPGEIVYGGPGSLRIGELDGVTRARTRALATLLRAAHPVEISDRIFALEWGKTALEAFYFGSAVADADVRELLAAPEPLRVLGAVVAEVAGVARAEGVTAEAVDGFAPEAFLTGDAAATEAAWAAQRRYWAGHTEARTGIWRDLAQRGRPTEVDAILGPVVLAAQRHGLHAPGIRRLVELVHEAEARGRPLGPHALTALAEAL